MADLQRAPDAAAPARLPLHADNVRTFDTPEFAGMEFLEVHTKTALNRVKGMGFKWSINPYRGCSHACIYCTAGETPILMGDGRTKPMADLRIGDEVYGTIQAAICRRYVITRVLDHWSTVKPGYRIVLRDGTELIASGDHRFLSNRGWKHVTGAERGPSQRPFLTTNNKLIGTGGFAAPPKDAPEYRRGYLCGMIRGDAWLADQLRFALIDQEGLRRTSDYLADHGVSPRDTDSVVDLIAWPVAASDDWCKGFLAGIFDAEGGYDQGVLRIFNADAEILGWIQSCLASFAIPFVEEPPQPNGCVSLRITGGLRQHLRFFHTVDPAITRVRSIEGVALESSAQLQVDAIEPLGIEIPMYDITTGTGDFIANGVVSHNCFARPSHAYLNMSPLGDFERKIVVKTNLVEVLERELRRSSWQREHVAMGTNTDNYQRCEGRYQLMPGVIRTLGSSGTPFSILTKGTLITRDLDLLAAANDEVDVSAAYTVGMLDEELWRAAEPGTPSPRSRLDAVRALNDAGIPTGVMLAPIMPGLNDDPEQLTALVDAIVAAGATHITPIVLHLRPGVKEVFMPWLEAAYPDLVGRYRGMYRGSNAPKAYREELSAVVGRARQAAWGRHGRPPPRRPRADAEPQPAPADSGAEQLSLF